MKTSEFIKRVNELGYDAIKYEDAMWSDNHTRVYRDSCIVAEVSEYGVNGLYTNWGVDVPYELFDTLVEYARTPVKER